MTTQQPGIVCRRSGRASLGRASSAMLLAGLLIAGMGVTSAAREPAAGPAAAGNDAKASGRPNILFILTDQQRRDCVGAYGNKGIDTPHLDGLSKKGVLFDRAYTAQPVCSPNRAAIITGLYPHSAGVSENKVPLPKRSLTLAEMLAPRGYDCGYFGKWHLERRDAFETFPEYPGDGRGNNHYFGEGGQRRYAVDVITDDAIAFLKKQRTKPFYLYVSFYPPHPPYSVPKEYEKRYEQIQDRNKRIYYAMCTKIDEAVGKLLQALEEIGAADNTLVVFTTDHGHNFERRWNDHDKRLCHDSAARIPLVMRMPGVLPEGRLTGGMISSVDLVPTMLSLIGQPVPTGLQGLDLSDLARGRKDRGRDYVFMENVPFPYAPDKGVERCVMDERWRLILSTIRAPELYDLQTDPDEKKNLWGEKKDSPIVTTLCEKLAQWAERTNDELAPQLLKSIRP